MSEHRGLIHSFCFGLGLALGGVCLPLSHSSAAERRPAQAQAAQDGVGGTVLENGAIIYTKPDYDAPTLSQLKPGERVRVSRGTTSGPMGKFHKVRIGNRIGYIAEIDVRIEFGSAAAPSAPSGLGAPKAKAPPAPVRSARPGERPAQAKKKPVAKKKEKPRPKMPFYFSRFVGATVGTAQFKEDISGIDATENILTYGLKVTGPDVLINGPVIDFNLNFHYGAPNYYSQLTALKATGFILWTDAMFMLPFMQGDNSALYLGLGPALVYSSFKIFNGGRLHELSTLNFGLATSLGYGWRVEKVAIRFEGKYYLEKKSYMAFQASLQSEF